MLNKYIYFLIFKGTDFSFRYKVMCTVDIKEYNKKNYFVLQPMKSKVEIPNKSIVLNN